MMTLSKDLGLLSVPTSVIPSTTVIRITSSEATSTTTMRRDEQDNTASQLLLGLWKNIGLMFFLTKALY